MGWVVPALAYVGGGSAVAGGVTLATLAAGAYAGIEQKKAGDAQAAQYKAEAKTEAAAAAQREVERRRNLIRALASQNAAAGAAGIQTDGSVEAVARRDIRDSQNDLLYSNLNTQARQRALRSQASNAQRAGRTAAVTSLMDTGRTAYQIGGGGGRKN